MLFEKDNTETIGMVSENLSGFFQDIVEFVAKVIDYLNKYFAKGGELDDEEE